jgi:spore photoproduct lyase-like protein
VVVAKEELKTAGLERRLAAARAVVARGYPVGFHLDPMIHHPSWRDGYAFLVDSIVDAVPPERIAWISIGGLRFPPEMKATMAGRFPRSELRYGELLRGEDGKMHYLRPLRLEMYRWVVERLRARLPGPERGPVVYLCMEPPEVWKSVFGERAPSLDELDHRFAASYHRRFRLASLPAPELKHYRPSAGDGAPPQAPAAFVAVDSLRAFTTSPRSL